MCLLVKAVTHLFVDEEAASFKGQFRRPHVPKLLPAYFLHGAFGNLYHIFVELDVSGHILLRLAMFHK